MPDPLDHAILSAPETREAAIEIVNVMLTELPTNLSLTALLMALGNTFRNLCDDYDYDPEAAFAQVIDYLARTSDDLPAECPHVATPMFN